MAQKRRSKKRAKKVVKGRGRPAASTAAETPAYLADLEPSPAQDPAAWIVSHQQRLDAQMAVLQTVQKRLKTLEDKPDPDADLQLQIDFLRRKTLEATDNESLINKHRALTARVHALEEAHGMHRLGGDHPVHGTPAGLHRHEGDPPFAWFYRQQSLPGRPGDRWVSKAMVTRAIVAVLGTGTQLDTYATLQKELLDAVEDL
jgi:hypothetical protein